MIFDFSQNFAQCGSQSGLTTFSDNSAGKDLTIQEQFSVFLIYDRVQYADVRIMSGLLQKQQI